MRREMNGAVAPTALVGSGAGLQMWIDESQRLLQKRNFSG
jgi:hypothetical protein